MTGGKKAGCTVFLMMAATVAAKALGVVRQMLIAAVYGTGYAADAFNAASAIPLTVFDILLGAAIPGAFIPAYNRLLAKKGSERADEFAGRFLNAIFVFTGGLALLGMIFAPQLTELIASELSGETKALALRLLRIMFPMIIFTGGAYTLTGIMQSKGRFMLPAFISSVSNAVMIIYLAVFSRSLGERSIYGLSIASAVSWLAQLLILAVPLAVSGRERFHIRPSLGIADPDLPAALRAAPPVMVGAWLTPLTLLIGTRFSAIAAGEGGITVFSNAYHTYILITGILTYSICNYVFPELSRLSAGKDSIRFAAEVRSGLRSALMISLPFTAAVWLLAPQGISALYLRGQFTASGAEQAAAALRFLAISIPAFTMVEVLNRAFYAAGMSRVPMTAALCGIAADAAATAILVYGGFVSGIAAVAVGASCAQITAAAILVCFSLKRIKGIFSGFFTGRDGFLPVIAGTAVSAAVMILVYRFYPSLPYSDGALRNIIACAAVFLPGAAVYAGLLFAFMKSDKNREKGR